MESGFESMKLVPSPQRGSAVRWVPGFAAYTLLSILWHLRRLMRGTSTITVSDYWLEDNSSKGSSRHNHAVPNQSGPAFWTLWRGAALMTQTPLAVMIASPARPPVGGYRRILKGFIAAFGPSRSGRYVVKN